MTNVEISQFLSELALLLESDIFCRDALEIIQQESIEPTIKVYTLELSVNKPLA